MPLGTAFQREGETRASGFANMPLMRQLQIHSAALISPATPISLLLRARLR